MTRALERLENVQESMRQLRRDLDAPNHYFNPEEVTRKVAERRERADREADTREGTDVVQR